MTLRQGMYCGTCKFASFDGVEFDFDIFCTAYGMELSKTNLCDEYERRPPDDTTGNDGEGEC